MIKVVRLVRKAPGMSREEFRNYWLTKHAELEREIATYSPVRVIKVSFAVDQYADREGAQVLGEQGEPDFDAILELYFDDVADLHVDFDSDVPQRILDDEQQFVDHAGGLVRVLTEEVVIVDKTAANRAGG